MKRLILAAMALCAMTGAAGAKSITLDGTCDRILLVPQFRPIFTSTESKKCGDATDGIGTIVKTEGGRFLSVGARDDGDPSSQLSYLFQYPLVTGGSWTSYKTTDGKMIFESTGGGTYSLGSAAPGSGIANAPSPPRLHGAPARLVTATIQLDLGSCYVYDIKVVDKFYAGIAPAAGNCAMPFVGEGVDGFMSNHHMLVLGAQADASTTEYTIDIQYPLVSGGFWQAYQTSDGRNLLGGGAGYYTVVSSSAAKK